MQAKMAKAQKNRASKQKYVGQNQLTINGFETPFSRSLNPIAVMLSFIIFN
jgi:hypothetical protein